MRIKDLSIVFAATVVAISLVTLHMASAASSPSYSPAKPNSRQDAMNSIIAGGLHLANQSSQQWQQKHNQSNDQQEQPLIENSLINHNNKFDNHSPIELPF